VSGSSRGIEVPVARRSINVLAELGVEIQWVESYICGDKIYCVYLAADEELIREHGRLTGIPCNSILQISKVIDPSFGFAPNPPLIPRPV
jgi:hypothetical protein